jgi:hypothetical protein
MNEEESVQGTNKRNDQSAQSLHGDCMQRAARILAYAYLMLCPGLASFLSACGSL